MQGVWKYRMPGMRVPLNEQRKKQKQKNKTRMSDTNNEWCLVERDDGGPSSSFLSWSVPQWRDDYTQCPHISTRIPRWHGNVDQIKVRAGLRNIEKQQNEEKADETFESNMRAYDNMCAISALGNFKTYKDVLLSRQTERAFDMQVVLSRHQCSPLQDAYAAHCMDMIFKNRVDLPLLMPIVGADLTEMPQGSKCLYHPQYGALTYVPGYLNVIRVGIHHVPTLSIDRECIHTCEDLGEWKLARQEDHKFMVFKRGFVFGIDGKKQTYPDARGCIRLESKDNSFYTNPYFHIDIAIMELFGSPPPIPPVLCRISQIKAYRLIDPFALDNIYWDLNTDSKFILPEHVKAWSEYYAKHVANK